MVAVAHLVEHVLEGGHHFAAHLLGDVVLTDDVGSASMVAHENAHVVQTEGVFAIATHVDAHGHQRVGHLVRDGMRPVLEGNGGGGAELVV